MIANSEYNRTSNLLAFSLQLVMMIMLIITPSKQEYQQGLKRQTMNSYCLSITNCRDCVKSVYRCEWCHNIGCTNNAEIHCPKKEFLENSWQTQHNGRFCTEVVTKSPLFVPANAKRFIKVKLRIGDLAIYEHSIICELHLEGRVYRSTGTLNGSAVYCDSMILSIKGNVAVAYLKLVWGGAEASSNVVLVIVYSCNRLASTCKDCQNLSTELKCGWCKYSMSCSLMEECPRMLAPWVTRNLTCREDINVPRYVGK